MDRRTCLEILAGSLLAPVVAEAQLAGKTYRIGWLAPAPNPENLSAFRSSLRQLGYVEGNNLVIEERYAEDRGAQFGRAVAGLVGSSLDVIVTDGSAATTALKRTGTSVPVVFVSGDPVAMGLVSSLSRPGGTMTGFAIISTELNVKRLELLREALPQASRLGVLHEPRQRRNMLPAIEAAARVQGFQLTLLEVRAVADIEGAFATAARERVAVVMPVASALFNAEKRRLVSLAAKHRLPAMYENRAFAEAGGLMSYGPDVVDMFQRAATYVDRILTGTKPADLPIQQPTKFELVLNLRTAKTLGLTIQQSLVQRADQVIE